MHADFTPCYHVVHRAARARVLFETEQDYWAYLDLLRRGLMKTECRLAAWCLLPERVELVACPPAPKSLVLLSRLVDQRYAAYCNVRFDRRGPAWAARPRVNALLPGFELLAMLHTETAAGVRPAEDYPWSSAGAHVVGNDALGLLDLGLGARFGAGGAWSALLEVHAQSEAGRAAAA